MANQIRYQVGFDIQQNNLNQLKASLQQLNKLKIGDIMKINDSDASAASTALNNIRKEAARVEDALKAAFNTKLNTVNIETFNKQLSKTGGSINEVYKTFKQAGTAGENAFRSLSSFFNTSPPNPYHKIFSSSFWADSSIKFKILFRSAKLLK